MRLSGSIKKFLGNGSDGVLNTTVNLLTANQSNVETDTSGFPLMGTGVTISRDASKSWLGTASLKIICDGSVAGQGVYVFVSKSAGSVVNYAGQVRATGAGTLTVGTYGSVDPATTILSTIQALDGTWRRLDAICASGLNDTGINFSIKTTTPQAVTFWIDGLKLETGTVINFWTVGGTGNVILPSTQDGPTVVLQCTSVTVNAGHSITVDKRCKGLVIYSQGNVTVNGTASMTQRGPFHPMDGTVAPIFVPTSLGDGVLSLGSSFGFTNAYLLLGPGGNGGNAGIGAITSGYTAAAGGTGGKGRYFAGGNGGGGGGGGCQGNIAGANGSNGDHQPGVGGTGATASNSAKTGSVGQYGGGGGGAANGNPYQGGQTITAIAGNGGGGAGGGGGGGMYAFANMTNATYDGSNPGADGGFAGGFLLFIVGGNLTIGSGGIIEANGGSGGKGANYGTTDGTNYPYSGGGGGGGGSGGGIIGLLYRGTFTNTGSITVNGGAGGLPGSSGTGYVAAQVGTAGSAGSITTLKIA